MMYRNKQKLILALALLSVFTVMNFTFYYHYGNHGMAADQFEGFDHINGSLAAIVPNTVHYILFGTDSLNFISFLSMTSVLKIQNPDSILIHTDRDRLQGYYWDLVQNLAKLKKTQIQLALIERPTHVFGQPLSSVYHMTDVARILVLMNFGGIYLDTDTIVLRSLNPLLKYEMVVGWPQKENIGTQILIAHKDARFLKQWLNGYRRYQPRNWYYNAGQFPAEVLSKKPELAHREDTLLGVQNLIEKLYVADEWSSWKNFYSLHLLSRHHPDPDKLDETSVTLYKHPFGEIASWLLYTVEPPLIIDGFKRWKF
ncbi:unnamed protein product [Bemisia tabaci]|uniref:Alpha-1,4-N-acetylglucosaminyltransferase n=2 Tax=Bemisia tabaci TaxID=7038 RepID=A0A9P0F7T9_BEMTA|nr:unnamed protein product [Bemisia tabaci]